MTNSQKGWRLNAPLQPKVLITALFMLLSATTLCAASYHIDGIVNGMVWNNSTIDYFVEAKPDGSFVFTGCDEGQDLAFRLAPNPEKKDEYLVLDENPNYTLNPFEQIVRAKHVQKEGQNLLCLYDNQGRLCDVLSPLEFHDSLQQGLWKRACQLMGEYNTIHNEPVEIESKDGLIFSSAYHKYKPILFNSIITDVIEIKGDTRLQGLWKVKITDRGLQLTQVTADEDFRFFEPTGRKETFVWARRDVPRFKFASDILLNGDMLSSIDKETLRMMRNEILFHHGYVPQAQDLNNYLMYKDWYKPRESNDGIFDDLTLIEKLNIELIKTAEAGKNDADNDSDDDEDGDSDIDNDADNDSDIDADFDFEKYRKEMEEEAEANLNYRKSMEDISLISYALIDIDGDGILEVWVRDDGSQDFEGIFGFGTDGKLTLIENKDARSELAFYPGAVRSFGYYGMGEFRESITLVKDSRQIGYGISRQLIDGNTDETVEADFNINGKKVSEAEFKAFRESLGSSYVPEVKWHNAASRSASHN